MTAETAALLVLQVACSATFLWALSRSLARDAAAGPASTSMLVVDVWLPVLLVVPLLAFVFRTGPSVRGAGWVALAGPVHVGAIALLAAIARGWADRDVASLPGRWYGTVVGAAVLLLMLGAVHDLTLGVGQTIFVVAAVVLWINTMPADAAGGARDAPGGRAGTPMRLLALAASAGQGACVLLGDGGGDAGAGVATIAAAVLVMATAAAAVVLIAVRAGADTALRVGGWVASLGIMVAVGCLSLRHLVAQMREVVTTPPQDRVVTTFVAHGFGIFAAEAVALLVVAGAAFAVTRARRIPPLPGLGILGALVIAGLAATRLRGM